MSNKTIKITPSLFNISSNNGASKTLKMRNKTDTNRPQNIPSSLRNRLLKRIEKYKNNELKKKNRNDFQFSFKSKKPVVDKPVASNEFDESIQYLQNKPEEKRNSNHTIKNFRTTDNNVSIDLPLELKEKWCDDVPFGIMKNGTKPTYRQYYNKTLKNNYSHGRPNEQKPFIPEQKSTIFEQKPFVFEHKPFVMEEIKPEQKSTIFEQNLIISEQPPAVFEQTPIISEQKPLELKENIDPDDIVTKITKKTIKRKHTLGKSKDKRRIGVLLKNKKTQKNVINAYNDLKKTSIKDIKNYLFRHNLIKIGSDVPNDVCREIYENSKLTGNVINTNNTTIIHNLENLDQLKSD